MNLLKYISTYFSRVKKGLSALVATLVVLFVPFLSSCSENVDFSEGINEIPEGYLLINLGVPDPVTVVTRVGDYDITKLDVFIFSENGNEFYQHNEYNGLSISSAYSVNIPLGTKARNNQVTIYAVANVYDNGIGNVNSIDNLKKYELSVSDFSYGYPMIGFIKTDTSSGTANISLSRNAAKISAACTREGVTLEEFKVYYYSTKAYLGSPINFEDQYNDHIYNLSLSENPKEAKNLSAYVYPSKGVSKEDLDAGNIYAGAFLVVKLKRNNLDHFYRINLRNGNGSGSESEFLNLEANHHYKLQITGIFTDGYSSYEDATKHPESDQYVNYKIHDHASEVLSMITDGYNELGVTPEVTLNTSENGKKATVVVKCYHPGVSLDNPVKKDEVEFSSNEFIVVEFKGEHKFTDNEDETLNDYNKSWDEDNPGTQFEYKISLKEDVNVYEDQTWVLNVKWNGLERKVTVNYEAAFLLPEVCDVTLTIKNNDKPDTYTILNYWNFITSQGEDSTQGSSSTDINGTPRLLGILPENMTGGKKRTNGFHFPMPYGEKFKSEPWEYEYTVDFTKLSQRDDVKNTITKIEAEINGDDFIKNNVKWNYTSGTSGKLYIEKSLEDYTYAGGNVTFTVSYTDGNTSTIIASLYHTGFFHYEGDSKYVPSESDNNKLGYYYYEVVPMAGGYWLDRNIGATANTSFIDIEDESLKYDRSAAGNLYTIIEEPKDFELPKFDFHMVPPGYHIPNQTEWDNLRINDNLKTQSVLYNKTYYLSTYYTTGNPKIGNIYIQKGRYRNDKNIYQQANKYSVEPNVGDAGAAYYWSLTEAPAMEKEQMGNWLRALYLNGSASSYMNASVTDHRMLVRCKAGSLNDVEDSKEYYISFNVHNATHVFFFYKDNGTPLYTFPGKAIGTTESAEVWQHFYTTTTINPEELLMLFIKLETNGTVNIYRKNGEKFTSSIRYNENYLNANYAWDIETGKYYDFCQAAKTRDDNYITGYQPKKPDCEDGDNASSSSSGDGTFEWSGWFQGDWSGWTGLSNYDWSSVTAGSKLKIDMQVWYWQEAVVRLCQNRDGWPIIEEYKFSKDDTFTFEINLTQNIIDKIIDGNGLIIQICKMGISKVVIEK